MRGAGERAEKASEREKDSLELLVKPISCSQLEFSSIWDGTFFPFEVLTRLEMDLNQAFKSSRQDYTVASASKLLLCDSHLQDIQHQQ
jgi:hypothetical protein